MVARAVLVLLALMVAPLQPPSGRVLMLSLDGMGHQRLTEDPVTAELPTLTALLKTGARADGLRPAFPASTANSHAALWTGTYAGRNGILYNSTPLLPRSGHTYAERVSGYRSESLTAEPIWLAAARQGVTVVAHQVTQIVPFLPRTIGNRPMPGLVAVNGFQSRTFAPWRTVRVTDADVHAIACAQLPAPIRGATRCVEWSLGRELGDRRLRAGVFPDRMVIADAGSETTIEVVRRAAETTPPKERVLARHWSTPLRLADPPDATAVSLTFRLFELDAAGGTFLLIQSPLTALAVASTDRWLAASLVADTGPMVGNGASASYAGGSFGPPAFAGGSGEAERRYLETLELVVRQQIAQSAWLFKKRQPRLHISYLSTVDEADHAWYGLDRAGVGAFREFRRWAYMAVEQALRAFTSLATSRDHIVITSDHGMAAVTRLLAIDRVLDAAGLRPLASSVHSCIVLNTADRKGGTIATTDRDAAIERVRRALAELRTAAGTPAVARIYSTQDDMRELGHDGAGGADLCFDPATGIGIGTPGTPDVIGDVYPPRGEHGMDPSRPDMKAILLVKGPRAGAGQTFGPLRSSAVAPLVADLLGVQPPRDATDVSPLAVLQERRR